jgi:hypothetical protein
MVSQNIDTYLSSEQIVSHARNFDRSATVESVGVMSSGRGFHEK